MMRPTREQALMESAYIWARRSTCSRLQVGCVFEREGRILVQGYNGAPAGLKHCDHTCVCKEDFPYDLTSDEGVTSTIHQRNCPAGIPCTRSVHAEQNAISFAARWGVELARSSAWITHQPCISCAQSLINAGVKRVIYNEPYRLEDGLDLLEEARIDVARIVDFSISN